jgi:hypothetical protein
MSALRISDDLSAQRIAVGRRSSGAEAADTCRAQLGFGWADSHETAAPRLGDRHTDQVAERWGAAEKEVEQVPTTKVRLQIQDIELETTVPRLRAFAGPQATE